MSKEEILQRAIAGVTLARSYTDDVEFSCEDAIRTERDYMKQVCEAVIQAGATTINMPDTVGYTTPEEIQDLFEFLTTEVEGADKVIFSAHCHNDLGLAVANSLAAIRGGARQVECALNGIGERAGNCALEEVVMALRTRKDFFGLETGIETQGIYAASKLLATITGNPVPRNKAIVGKNAFAHESGIHQHGVLANRETYEIMKPEDVGVSTDNLVLGKHSGRAALRARAESWVSPWRIINSPPSSPHLKLWPMIKRKSLIPTLKRSSWAKPLACKGRGPLTRFMSPRGRMITASPKPLSASPMKTAAVRPMSAAPKAR